MKSFPLVSGAAIPALGLGTWQLEGEAIEKPLAEALEVGFRHIDTAWIYANQTIIGKVLAKSDLPRQDLFLTSKVWHSHLEKEKVRRSCQESLKQLLISESKKTFAISTGLWLPLIHLAGK